MHSSFITCVRTSGLSGAILIFLTKYAGNYVFYQDIVWEFFTLNLGTFLLHLVIPFQKPVIIRKLIIKPFNE